MKGSTPAVGCSATRARHLFVVTDSENSGQTKAQRLIYQALKLLIYMYSARVKISQVCKCVLTLAHAAAADTLSCLRGLQTKDNPNDCTLSAATSTVAPTVQSHYLGVKAKCTD